MQIQGKNFIGYSLSSKGAEVVYAYNPSTGQALPGDFVSATEEELDMTLSLASRSFIAYRCLTPSKRAEFLEAIAESIMELGDVLVERANRETALPEARIVGERGRTVAQLRAFAELVREGSWVEAIIDRADRNRKPVPKPDIRRMLVPLGPVAVFAASNFPLAFSVAGGDTASALAGGNPVIVKAHSGHMGTSELIARAIIKAAQQTGMPDGVFSMVYGDGRTVGQALVQHPALKAVGFTGSRSAVKTLFRLANERPEPIPVFAEMGSINPVLLTPAALEARCEEIAAMYAGSITLGVGQFCTNPGLLLGLAGTPLRQFIDLLARKIEEILPATMLNSKVYDGFRLAYEQMLAHPEVQVQGRSATEHNAARLEGMPTVASVEGREFLHNPRLHEEVFGPFSLVVQCSDMEELYAVACSIEGQLTTTVIAEPDEWDTYGKVIETLQQRCGRIIFNGVPTGVEVCAAMQHGGPHPATTDSRFTSVGATAIKRFARPLAFQDWPDAWLPESLQNDNPLGIWRLTDNCWTRDTIV